MSDAEDQFREDQGGEFDTRYATLKAKNANTYRSDNKNLVSIYSRTTLNLPYDSVITTVLVPSKGPIVAGHLSQPITSEDQNAILHYSAANMKCKRHKQWLHIRENNNIDSHMYEPNCPCIPYRCVKNKIIEVAKLHEKMKGLSKPYPTQTMSDVYSTWFNDTYEMALRNAFFKKYNYEAPIHHLLPPYIDYITQHMTKYRIPFTFKDNLEQLYIEKMRAELVKDVLCNKRIPNSKFRMPHNEVLYDIETVLYYCITHTKWVLCPTTLWINMLDMMQAKFSIHMSWALSDLDRKYGELSIFEEGTRIMSLLESVRNSKKIPKFFDFLGKWEALVIGSIIEQPTDEGCTTLYTEVYYGLKSDAERNIVPRIIPIRRTLDEQRMYLEIVGINKSLGHPCIDMAKSLDVVREHGGKRVLVKSEAIYNVVAKITEIFCKAYFSRHQRYPPVEHNGGRLCDIMINLNRPIQRADNIDLEYFQGLVFLKTFQFDYNFDTSTLIKDTACAPLLSNWSSSYDDCAFAELYNKPHPGHSYCYNNTRVVLNYLQGDPSDVMTKINEIEAMYFNPEHNLCSYCRKEREIKDDGRVFMKLCYLQRLIQVLREKNIAEFIFPYFEDQTMTNTEVQVLKRQERLSNPDKVTEVIINIDLSKWNLYFRDYTVRPLGRVLDQLFGFKHLYAETHRWFLLAKIFCNSRLCPPDYNVHTKEPIPGPFFINDHEGGGEGMCQKLWTLINIGVIRLVSDNMGLRATVMGQGDNQVVMLQLTLEQSKTKNQLRDEFMERLEQGFSDIGLKLKPQETWYSSRLFEYGKQRYLEGVAVSNLTKQAGRLIPDINQGILSIQSCLAQINTTTEGASKTELSCIGPFIQNQFETINYLFRSGICSRQEILNETERFLYFPSILGGFPSSLYFSHSVRGNDDPLPQWLSLIESLYKLRPDLFKYVIRIVDLRSKCFPYYNKLLFDIRSLNNIPLPSPESMVKECTHDFLAYKKQIVTNREIRKLFDPSITIGLETIVAHLMTMEPLLLPLAHEVLRVSNAGILLALQNKMTTSSTVTKVVSETKGHDFHNYSVYLQSTLVLELKSRDLENTLTVVNYIKDQVCPSKLSTYLRKQHWLRNLIAPTKPTQNHQFKMVPLDEASFPEKISGIIITISSAFRDAKCLSLMSKGPYDSYIGNKTREKLMEPLIKLTSRPSEVKCYQTLYTLLTWGKNIQGTNLMKLITQLMDEKTPDLPEELLEMDDELFCPSVSGGNIVHRLKGALEKNVGVRNLNPSIGSHFSFSTNEIKEFNKGGKDYTLHFQNAYHYSESLLINMKLLGLEIKSQYVFSVVCNSCTIDVTDATIDINDPGNISVTPSLKGRHVREAQVIDPKDMGDEDQIRKYMSLYIGKLIGRQIDSDENRTYISTAPNSTREMGRLEDVSTYFFKTLDFEYMIVGIIFESDLFKKLLVSSNRLSNSTLQIDVMSNFASMLIESERIQDYFLWSRTHVTTHNIFLNPRELGNTIFKRLLEIVWDNPWRYVSHVLSPLFADEDPYKMRTIINWLYKHQNYICPGEERIVIINPSIFEYDIPKPSHILAEYNNTNFTFRQYLVKKLLLTCVSRKFYRELPFSRTAVLPAYKAINTMHSFNMALRLPSPIRVHLTETRYGIEVLRNLYLHISEVGDGRVIQIPFVQHFARLVGCISSAATKYFEVLYLLRIPPTQAPSISLHLAEGSGSILWFYCNYFNCPVGYNTLMSPEVDNRRHQSLRIPPAALSFNGYCATQLRYTHLLGEGETDITKPDFKEKYRCILRIETSAYVTIDSVSANSYINFSILLDYLTMMMKFPSVKLFICKIQIQTQKISDWYTNMYPAISSILQPGYTWALVKPITSHPCNSEIMFVCMKDDHFSDETRMQLTNLKQLFNTHILSHLPLKGFHLSTFEVYIRSSRLVRDMLNNTLLRDHNFLRYRHKNTNIYGASVCGITCLSVHNHNIGVLDQIARSPTLETEFSMDATTKRLGTSGVIQNLMCHILYSLVHNLCEDEIISHKDLFRATRFEILYTGIYGRRPLLWHTRLPDLGYIKTAPYEDEEVKNFYREGRTCICEQTTGDPYFITQFLILSVIAEEVYIPDNKITRFYNNLNQFECHVNNCLDLPQYSNVIDDKNSLRRALIHRYQTALSDVKEEC